MKAIAGGVTPSSEARHDESSNFSLAVNKAVKEDIDPAKNAKQKRRSRQTPASSPPSVAQAEKPACVQIFCSYAHKDAKYRGELEIFLANLRMQGLVHIWHDRLIKPGTDWARDIDRNLDHADVILLLVSADFMASQYCMGIELKQALERSEMGSARVVPILIRECDLAGARFGKLQWLPTGSKPVKKWTDRDSAWTDVAKGVRKVVEELAASRPTR